MTYSYIGKDGKPSNRLTSIVENGNIDHGYIGEGGGYEYDDFGNMIKDNNKKINIKYNYLGLPEDITWTEIDASIKITYDAAGNKIKKVVAGEDEEGNAINYILHYIGGIEYNGNDIESIHHAEGRVTINELNKEPQYEYHLKDHLGNVRVTFADKDKDGYLEPFNVNPNEPTPNEGGDDTVEDEVIDWASSDLSLIHISEPTRPY